MNNRKKWFSFAAVIFMGISSGAIFSKSTFNAEQMADIEQIVHNYLVNKNPEVLIEASRALQDKQMKAMQEKGVTNAKRYLNELLKNPDDIVMGNPKGTVTLVEFFDYNCSHCREMGPVINQLITDNPNLRVVFKDLPIFGNESEYSAKVAYAAYKEGKYLEFHDAILTSNKLADRNFVKTIAAKIGLKWNLLEKEMKTNEKTFKKLTTDNMQLAQKMMDVVATPAFVVAKTDAASSAPVEFRPGGGSIQDMQAMVDRVQKS